jgi:hypothetical protein
VHHLNFYVSFAPVARVEITIAMQGQVQKVAARKRANSGRSRQSNKLEIHWEGTRTIYSDISRRTGARTAPRGEICALGNEVARGRADLGGLVNGGGELREEVEA